MNEEMNSIIIASARFLSTMISRDVRELVYYTDTRYLQNTCTRDFNKHKLSSTIEIYRYNAVYISTASYRNKIAK